MFRRNVELTERKIMAKQKVEIEVPNGYEFGRPCTAEEAKSIIDAAKKAVPECTCTREGCGWSGKLSEMKQIWSDDGASAWHVCPVCHGNPIMADARGK